MTNESIRAAFERFWQHVVARLGDKASTSDLTSHTGNTTIHVTSTDKSKWNSAQANVIESIKVNGKAQTISSKSVDITVPTDNNQLTNGAQYITAAAISNKADKATTLAGYGITDAADKIHTHDDRYYIKSDVDTKITATKEYAVEQAAAAVENKVDKVDGKGLSTNDLTAALKSNYDAAYTHTSNTSNPHSVTKAQVGLGNVENKSSATIRSEITSANVTTALGFTPSKSDHTHAYIPTSEKGTASGVATLDTSGRVPISQLPSYVDDVLEYDKLASFPTEGETGKIYIAKDSNKTYRWSGTTYTVISETLALGETSSTAYAGDKGKANATAIADLQTKVGDISVAEQISEALAGKADTNHTHTWDDIQGKPFETIGGDTLTWDGNRDGLEVMDENAFKVSNSAPTPDNLQNGGSISLFYPETNETSIIPFNLDNCLIDSGVVGIVGDLSSQMPLVIMISDANLTSPGTYFFDFSNLGPDQPCVTSLTINGYTGFGKEVIKEECLPDGVRVKAITIPAGRMKGDIDGDGFITTTDRVIANAHFKKDPLLTDETQLLCADINGDGKVNIIDVNSISTMAAGTNKFGRYALDITNTWTVNPNYQTEEGQFYKDIAVSGITATSDVVVVVKDNIGNAKFTNVVCMDGAIRVYATAVPIETLTAFINYTEGTGESVIFSTFKEDTSILKPKTLILTDTETDNLYEIQIQNGQLVSMPVE